MSDERYSKADVEALIDIAVKAREHMKPECPHPIEWRTKGICGICLQVADKREAGLYNKFHIERTDGSSAPGGKHETCKYFVLDVHCDQHAIPALMAYADSCKADYPLLARDLVAQAQANCDHDMTDTLHGPD